MARFVLSWFGGDCCTGKYDTCAEHADRIDRGLATLESVAERLAFAATADDFGAALLMLDYLQRIRPPGEHGASTLVVGDELAIFVAPITLVVFHAGDADARGIRHARRLLGVGGGGCCCAPGGRPRRAASSV
ncbi:MAG: hypothetical protein L6Q92_04680 [Phycisphaerae bacterium]|nr:hypothetical protein [Phycisphaerae bacterium]